MIERTEHRIRSLILPLAACVLAVAGACAPQEAERVDQPTDETTEPAAEEATGAETETDVEPVVVEQGAGTFELILGGDVEGVQRGTASCVVERTGEASDLRASLDPRGPSDHRFYLVVPEYDGQTDTYEGEFQISGAERSAGPVDVGISRERGEEGTFEPQLTIAFEGTYAGAAGVGSAEGEVICSLPNDGEPLLGAEPEAEDEP